MAYLSDRLELMSFLTICQSHSARDSGLGPVEQVNEALVAGALHFLDFLTTLIDLESGHALDAGSLSDVSSCVDIDLLHDELGVIRDVAFVDRTDTLAGRAPGGSEVDDEGLVAVLESLEVSHTRDVHVAHCVVLFLVVENRL